MVILIIKIENYGLTYLYTLFKLEVIYNKNIFNYLQSIITTLFVNLNSFSCLIPIIIITINEI